MPGSTFRLCIECQAHIWVASAKCKECGAQQPTKLQGLQGLMDERKESKKSPLQFTYCPAYPGSSLFSSPETKPVMSGKGKSFIAPATFSASPNGCPDVEDRPWRQVDWTEENNEKLRESIYKLASDSKPAARVLLIGPVGAGKSSFINSIQSVFYGRVVNRAMVGTSLNPTASFTKQMQSFWLFAGMEPEDETLPVILSDMVGMGETNGLTLHDMLAVIKGNVPEGHKFSACCPVVSDNPDYVRNPSLVKRVHCVVFVLNYRELDSYLDNMKSTFYQLREHISVMGVQQMAVLTHVDKDCSSEVCDISKVYNGPHLRHAMLKVSDLLGMPLSSIIPVKNYSEELELDPHTDTLLLQALDHILLYANLYLRDHPETDRAEGGDGVVSQSS